MTNKPRIANSLTREPRSLKEATTRLLMGFPTVEKAARHCRAQRSTLDEYANTNRRDRFIPVDVALDLEHKLGDPVITSYMARRSGYALYKLPNGQISPKWESHFSKIVKEGSEVFAAAADALADGSISPEEATNIIKELDEAIHSFVDFRKSLEQVAQKARQRKAS
ncbi:phage regulatory CII family protein [Tepidicaulis sp. LMO-SS28]|uniref:phage regulatory CII family protein n=1 Tax=Tepidicaulis sp. LMO-SS28 TaxID=3447455 RepID=UPI003EE1CE07